jgi:hypothetical protein
MTDQRLGSAEIFVAAGIVGCLFVLGAVVAYRFAPDESGAIVTALCIAIAAVAIVAITASLEERIPEGIALRPDGHITPEAPDVPALNRWMQTLDRAAEDDNAQLLSVLHNPLARVAVGLGAAELSADGENTPTPEALLEAIERL